MTYNGIDTEHVGREICLAANGDTVPLVDEADEVQSGHMPRTYTWDMADLDSPWSLKPASLHGLRGLESRPLRQFRAVESRRLTPGGPLVVQFEWTSDA